MMKNTVLLIVFSTFISCKKEGKIQTIVEEETYTIGKVNIMVDETLLPVIEEQEMVFESDYRNAKITLQSQTETEIINQLIQGKGEVAIIAKELSENNKAAIEQTNRSVKITPICSDAIALIINKSDKIEKISVNDVLNMIKGSNNKYQLVFDNENSSTLNYLMEKANVKTLPKNVTAVKNNQEVVKFVASNINTIGFLGVNWLQNQDDITTNYLKTVKVLAVGNSIENAVKPTQAKLSTNEYPFIRKINLLNLQGRNGLGMGFASFIKSDRGQRIILKSGLLPVNMPSREIKFIKSN
jgi:phosphate transport system substrate-binding protein